MIYKNMFVLYIGHTKFPDWMASWTAGVQKSNCKCSDITVAIQAYRFVNFIWNLSI